MLDNNISSYLLDFIKESLSKDADIHLPYKGWDKIIISLHNKLMVLDSSYLIEHISSDCGMLEFDIETNIDILPVKEAMYKYIQMAKFDSTKTCFKCGKPGFISAKNNLLITRCRKCR